MLAKATVLKRSLNYLGNRYLLGKKQLVAKDLPYDMQFEFRTKDDVGRKIFKYGIHEPHIYDFLHNGFRVKPGDLLLDIGANLGWYSVLFDRLGEGRARVFSFEPDPQNYRLLERNLSLNDARSVTALSTGLSSRDDQATLYRYSEKNLGKHSMLRLPDLDDGIAVETQRLDTLLAERNLASAPIKLIKLDVEGYELEVLRGAKQALERTELVVMEYSPRYYSTYEAERIRRVLTSAGFSAQIFERGELHALSAADAGWLTGQYDMIWTKRPQH